MNILVEDDLLVRTCLVIGSSPTCRDFPKQKDIILNGNEIIDFIESSEGIRFPENVNFNKKYDLIWFCGCNVLSWIMSNYDLTFLALKNTKKVIFTETELYIKKVGNPRYKGDICMKIDDYLKKEILYVNRIKKVIKRFNSEFSINNSVLLQYQRNKFFI